MSSEVFTSLNVRLTVFAPVFACFHLYAFGYVQSNACYASHLEALCYWSSVAPDRTRWRLQHPLFSFWLPHSREWSMAPISLVSWMCQTWAHWHMDQQHPIHQQIPPHCRFKSTCGWHVEVQRFEWSTAAIEKQSGLHIVATGWKFGVPFYIYIYLYVPQESWDLKTGWFGDPRPLLCTSKPLYKRVQWFLGCFFPTLFLLFACVSNVGDCLGKGYFVFPVFHTLSTVAILSNSHLSQKLPHNLKQVKPLIPSLAYCI